LFTAGSNINHAVTLIGRRWNENKNTCEFLVRNSKGIANCTSYWKPGLDCNNNDGTAWVGEPEMREYNSLVYYLEKD
jgi:hypothetical protein